MNTIRQALVLVTLSALLWMAACSGPPAGQVELPVINRDIDVFPEAANFIFDIDVDYEQEKVFAECDSPSTRFHL